MARAIDDDDAALHWAGDEDAEREGARLPPETVVDAVEAPPDDLAPSRRGTALTAPFALLYLALTVGWILATGYTSAGSIDLATQVLWQFGEFTAILAAPLWFGTTVLLTPSRPGVRLGWLALGLGVLLPWPLLPLLLTAGAS